MAATVPPPETSPEGIPQVEPIRRVVVIGLGLIGGSLARDLAAAAEVELIGWDAEAAARAQARAAGIRVAETLAECVSGEPDLVVLAVPLAAMAPVCRELSALVTGRTWLTDVGSVKSPVRETVVANGLGERYLGSHPMAGTEATGFPASTAGMFHDAAWVLTVMPSTTEGAARPAAADGAPEVAVPEGVEVDPAAELRAVLAITELVTRVLGVRVYVLTDDQHDEAVALVSHLPHVLAAELLGQAAVSPVRDVAFALAAGSFRDGTRVAGTNPARTEAMVTGNAAWAAPLIDQAAARLTVLAARLRAGEDVGEFFAPVVAGPAGPAGQNDLLRFGETTQPELRRVLLDAGNRGRSIRSIDLAERSITLSAHDVAG